MVDQKVLEADQNILEAERRVGIGLQNVLSAVLNFWTASFGGEAIMLPLLVMSAPPLSKPVIMDASGRRGGQARGYCPKWGR